MYFDHSKTEEVGNVTDFDGGLCLHRNSNIRPTDGRKPSSESFCATQLLKNKQHVNSTQLYI